MITKEDIKKPRTKEKTTLCLTCQFGLVREWEDWLDESKTGLPCELRGKQAKCLLTRDFIQCITSCNRYKRNENAKITYHDPGFEKYIEKIEDQEDEEVVKEQKYVKVKEGDKWLK